MRVHQLCQAECSCSRRPCCVPLLPMCQPVIGQLVEECGAPTEAVRITAIRSTQQRPAQLPAVGQLVEECGVRRRRLALQKALGL